MYKRTNTVYPIIIQQFIQKSIPCKKPNFREKIPWTIQKTTSWAAPKHAVSQLKNPPPPPPGYTGSFNLVQLNLIPAGSAVSYWYIFCAHGTIG